ncbi:MAG: hypothetical protein KF884_12720 [Fimbriimonadaceae bacterium]|nr:hypothetical protein [Fimbriimonadaceae bacterium]QYK58405.1 MAG: hypothetical protein KF884_12720 [Fimbriimonadaceae bacterium]
MSSTVFDRPGLQGAKKVLKGFAEGASGGHAVLFYGIEGSGALECARELALTWLCPQGGPCRECPVCRTFEAGRAVDFQHVAPWGPSSMIKLDAIRPGQKPTSDPYPGVPLLEFFRSGPLMARTKAVLFEKVERMNPSTANALLKTLEEPAPFGRIVMTTSELGRVIPTVRSRCLCVACELPDQAEWAPADEVEATFGGTPGLVDRVRAHRPAFEELWNLLGQLDSAPPGAAMALAERMRKVGEALAKAEGTSARAGHAEALRCLAQWASHRDPALAIEAVEAHRLVLGNANAGIVIDALMASQAQRARAGTLG